MALNPPVPSGSWNMVKENRKEWKRINGFSTIFLLNSVTSSKSFKETKSIDISEKSSIYW